MIVEYVWVLSHLSVVASVGTERDQSDTFIGQASPFYQSEKKMDYMHML